MDEVKTILEAVQASLAPLRETKQRAQATVDQAIALKEQSAANVVEGEQDAALAHQLLADHRASVQAKKLARVKARAERIASGRPTPDLTVTDDADGRRLEENAEEADAALVQLREIDAKHAYELLKAEGDVVAAETQIYQQYIEGIANEIIQHDSIIKGLHAELTKLVPSEINRPRNQLPPSKLVQQAMALITIDWLNTPINKLRGEPVTSMQFTPTPKNGFPNQFAESSPIIGNAVPARDDITLVPGPKPRGMAKV